MAQQNRVPARVTSDVNDGARVALHGSVTGAVQPKFDVGVAEAQLPLTHVRLLLQRSTSQEAALEKYMAQELDPHSPNYHKWLTPAQFGKLYGPADSDVAAVTGWLQSHGLTVNMVPKSRLFVDFSGSAGQIEQAFGVSIHNFSVNGKSYHAAVSEPRIPAALKPVVAGIYGFNTQMLKHMVIQAGSGTMDPKTHKVTRVSGQTTGTSKAKPQYTFPEGDGYFLGISPADAATIYDTPNAYNSNFDSKSGTPYDGTGINIGVGGTALVNTAPLANYRQNFIGDSKLPTVVNLWDAPLSNDGEADLDLELAGGLAPGANIYYYPSSDLFSGVVQAAEDNIVDIFSLSYGGCEYFDGDAANLFYSQLWQQFAAQGITVNTAGGDSGSAGCDYYNGAEPAASYGLAVSGLASTPYNVAVGGTDTWGLVSDFTTYVSTKNNTWYGSALGYIPESTMNGSSAVNGDLADNTPFDLAVGSGGGPSSCVTSTTDSDNNVTCTGGWPKPSWQTGTGVPADKVRDIPDISLLMSSGYYNSAWLTCNDTYDCTDYIGLVGGTSASTPAFAGIEALIAQKAGGRLGQIAPELYTLAAGSSASKIFHDVTTGNNSMACVADSPDCVANTAGYNFLTGWNSSVGYDVTTGLGSVDATQLISAWAAFPANTPTVTVMPLEANIVAGQTAVINVTVAQASGTTVPTGTVTLTIPYSAFITTSYTSAAVAVNSVGVATFTIPASILGTGITSNTTEPFTLIANYSGDTNFAPASGTGTLNVYASLPATTTTVTTSTNNIGDLTPFTVTAMVAPATATGTVSFNATSGSTTVALGSAKLTGGTASVNVASLPVGAWSITAYYSGDANNAASASTPTVLTVLTGQFTITVSPTSATVSQGDATAAQITVTPTLDYRGYVGWSISSDDKSGTLTLYGSFCLSPLQVTSGSPVSGTLTIYTESTVCPNGTPIVQSVHSGAQKTTKPSTPIQPAGLAAGLAGLLLAGFIGYRSRKLRLLAVMIAIVSFGFGLSGCSSSSASNRVAKGSYNVTLTGTDTTGLGSTAAVNFTLVVK